MIALIIHLFEFMTLLQKREKCIYTYIWSRIYFIKINLEHDERNLFQIKIGYS